MTGWMLGIRGPRHTPPVCLHLVRERERMPLESRKTCGCLGRLELFSRWKGETELGRGDRQAAKGVWVFVFWV